MSDSDYAVPGCSKDPDPPIEKKKYRERLKNNVFNGNKYMVHEHLDEGFISLDCQNKKNAMMKCNASGYLLDELFFPHPVKFHHTHDPDFTLEAKKKFHEDLKETAKNSFLKSKEIFQICKSRSEPIIQSIPYSTKQRSICNFKKSSNPPTPETLSKYFEILNSDQYKSMLNYGSGSITTTLVTDDENNNSIAFFDSAFLEKVLYVRCAEKIELYIDSTFDMTPKKLHVRQFLTIQIGYLDKTIPVFFGLMEKKSESAYKGLFKIFFDILLNKTEYSTINVHLDFERAEENAIKSLVPDVQFTMCGFHYSQAILRNGRKKKAIRLPKKEETFDLQNYIIRDFVDSVMCLIHLPAESISLAYDHLYTDLCRLEGMTDKLILFDKYFRRQWIKHYPPEKWSLYRIKRRTNNASESWNSQLNSTFGHHPRIWDFTRKFVEEMKKIQISFEEITNNVIPSKKRRIDTEKENLLEHLQKQLDDEEIDIFHFVDKLKNVFGLRGEKWNSEVIPDLKMKIKRIIS